MVIQLKEMGFSLFEMNELIVQDYVDLVDAYTKTHSIPKGRGSGRRKGTPQEFAALFGEIS